MVVFGNELRLGTAELGRLKKKRVGKSWKHVVIKLSRQARYQELHLK